MKYDKIFIKKDFINSIPELNNSDKVADDTPEGRGIEEAPSILDLEDNEKFKDINGKPLNIEVRGDRKHDNCFFKVKDVSEAFEMPNLYTTIISSSSRYLINEDYKYFICQKRNNKCKKELFLTCAGFRKLIETSRRIKNNIDNKSVMHKWIFQNFDYDKVNNFNIDKKAITKSYNGYVYLITSNIIDYVKIGYWTGSIDGLLKRYNTYYGNKIDLFYVITKNAFQLEQKCHKYFIEYKLSNELFKKSNIENYKIFLLDNKENINYNPNTNDIENIIKSKDLYIQYLENKLKM